MLRFWVIDRSVLRFWVIVGLKMQFVSNNSEILKEPFLHYARQSHFVESGVKPIIVHTIDNIIQDDGNIHVYYDPPSYSGKDVFVLEHSGRRGNFLYIREGDNFAQIEQLISFLYDRSYRLKDSEEEELHFINNVTTDPFAIFISEIEKNTSGSLEQYLKEMLLSMGIKKSDVNHVLIYSNMFYVALVDQDMNMDQLTNYELLEFVGDLAAWKPMTDIFLEYAGKNNIVMTEQVMTAMHRSFASKEKQAQIAKRLNLNIYLKKKGEVTIDTYEDMFESFVGALYLTNFHLRALLTIDLNLHEQFLRWVYRSLDLSRYEEKPAITKFYEYVRVLVGSSVFRETEINKRWIMRFERGTMEVVVKRLMDYMKPADETRVKQIVVELFDLIGVSYANDAHSYESRRDKYDRINNLIELEITQDILRQMTNDRNMKDWEDDVKSGISGLIDLKVNVVSQRFVDKSKTSYYWIVQNAEGDIIYSTMDYDSAESPETLIRLIREQREGRQVLPNTSVEKVLYKDEPYYFEQAGKRWFLRGTPSSVETYVSREYESGRFYVVLSDGSKEGVHLEYDPRPRSYIDDPDGIRAVRALIEKQQTHYKPELSPAIHRYIGDRAAYGHTALIAVLRHKITNVHHLTDVRNFYRSKTLKKELTRLLDMHDAEGNLIEFDQVIGSNLQIAEEIIMFLYLQIPIKPEVIYRPEGRIKSIRMALYARTDAMQKRPTSQLIDNAKQEKIVERERIRKSSIQVVDGKYVYEASNGLRLSLPISGFDSERLKLIFADWILKYEKSINPTINTIRNFRFSTTPGFDTLRETMEFKNVSEWNLFKNNRGGIELRYFTAGDEEVVYVSGSDIESINRHL